MAHPKARYFRHELEALYKICTGDNENYYIGHSICNMLMAQWKRHLGWGLRKAYNSLPHINTSENFNWVVYRLCREALFEWKLADVALHVFDKEISVQLICKWRLMIGK